MNANVFPNPNYPSAEPGITKRELLAAMTMQGILSGPWLPKIIAAESARAGMEASEGFANSACMYADALIAELAKGKP
jgi:hypothetical protein